MYFIRYVLSLMNQSFIYTAGKQILIFFTQFYISFVIQYTSYNHCPHSTNSTRLRQNSTIARNPNGTQFLINATTNSFLQDIQAHSLCQPLRQLSRLSNNHLVVDVLVVVVGELYTILALADEIVKGLLALVDVDAVVGALQ